MPNRIAKTQMNNDPEHARASREWQENRAKVKSRRQKSIQRSNMLLRSAMSNRDSNLKVMQCRPGQKSQGNQTKNQRRARELEQARREIETLQNRIVAMQQSRDKSDFYNSPAWQRTRYEALKRSNGCCELCGDSKAIGAIIQVDHIKPRSKFPQLELDPSNLQVLCRPCNMGKSNRDSIDWRKPELKIVSGG